MFKRPYWFKRPFCVALALSKKGTTGGIYSWWRAQAIRDFPFWIKHIVRWVRADESADGLYMRHPLNGGTRRKNVKMSQPNWVQARPKSVTHGWTKDTLAAAIVQSSLCLSTAAQRTGTKNRAQNSFSRIFCGAGGSTVVLLCLMLSSITKQTRQEKEKRAWSVSR